MSWSIGIILLSGLLGAPGADSDRADRGRVIAAALDAFDRPEIDGYATAQLENGDEVLVLSEEPGGWLAIEPPKSEFLWIDEREIEVYARDRAEVIVSRAAARAARDGARMPGPPSLLLESGTTVRLLDRPSLVLRNGRDRRVWRAIAPPDGLLRYVRADGVRLSPRRGVTLSGRRVVVPDPATRQLVETGPAPPVGALSDSDLATFRRLDAEHRSILATPLERWRLDAVERGYQDLLSRVSDPTASAALRGRLDQVDRQIAAATAASRFTTIAGRLQRMDLQLQAAPPQRRSQLDSDAEPFDVTGLMMPSSKLVDGEKAYALIGPDGLTTAYLHFVPGLSAPRYLSRQVGIRGSSRLDPNLHARVFEVREIEALGDAP